MTLWDCTVCGAPDNQRAACWICGRGQLPEESEAAEAARLIHAAELEFSRALQMPIQLIVVGGVGPQTIEEAKLLIAEMREHVQEQLGGNGEPRGYGAVTTPQYDRWGD